jgi:RNA polymerase sigma factor (sigma-70 family)
MDNRNKEQNSAAWWGRLVHGDRHALSELFMAYHRDLLNYGYRIGGDRDAAKDAVQDVFVNLWKYHASLNPSVQVKFYLYRSLRRQLVRNLPGEKPVDFWETVLPDEDENVETVWIRQELEKESDSQLQHCLQQLSRRELEVISLKYYSDFKISEIADLLELQQQTVANTLQNALIKLRRILSARKTK